MLGIYYKYKQEIDNMTLSEFAEKLRLTKIYSAIDEKIGGKKVEEVKKLCHLCDSDLKSAGIKHGLTSIIYPERANKKKPEKTKSRKIKGGGIVTDDITLENLKNKSF